MQTTDTIVAYATPSGQGAIAVLRLSGPNAIQITDRIFKAKSQKTLAHCPSHTVHLGDVYDGTTLLDEVLVTIFRNPKSYTGEDVIEMACHGSIYIQQKLLQLCIAQGCRTANAGEFTLRAFLNGKLNLSQAEAVADLIASDSAASHEIAINQMRKGYANSIKILRQELLDYAALIELELDFSEEDVAFADRKALAKSLEKIAALFKSLIKSFATGNAIKNGIPVALVGAPNVGKSTLLNALLQDDRALVSDIAGTTRDTVEDEMVIDGLRFRFIDTAGIRQTNDTIEALGIERTFEKMAQAQIILYLFDLNSWVKNPKLHNSITTEVTKIEAQFPSKQLILVAHKADLLTEEEQQQWLSTFKHPTLQTHFVSGKTKLGLNTLEKDIITRTQLSKLFENQSIVSNSRHYEALTHALNAIETIQKGLSNNLSGDLLAIDLREALYFMGLITGEVSNDELLGHIFSNFCIGK